ncbi:MAG TPA: 2-C-methyl-D-erythritol 4-phosphate cytidylyltransferase [Erysipelothrix sp.]|nr:2-C-methyl-D-erythritol 4-phosphate cytidylyltransferase [Erysipelothrix sp.]
MKYSALIVAAGKGTRMGLGYNKMFYKLRKYGMTVLQKTTSIFMDDPRCAQIVIVTNQSDMPKVVRNHENQKIVHVNGGPTRQESVFLGLMAVSQDIVLIHDGARPWIDQESIDRLVNAMEHEKAAILAVKMKDTIKVIKDGYVEKTIDREQLINAQTPQAFETGLIINAYLKIFNKNIQVFDDAQAVELVTDTKVKIVQGSYLNNKITTIDDIKNT